MVLQARLSNDLQTFFQSDEPEKKSSADFTIFIGSIRSREGARKQLWDLSRRSCPGWRVWDTFQQYYLDLCKGVLIFGWVSGKAYEDIWDRKLAVLEHSSAQRLSVYPR